MARGDEIIRVFDSRRDTLEVDQRPERVVFQPCGELLLGNSGKDRHEQEKKESESIAGSGNPLPFMERQNSRITHIGGRMR